MKLYFLITKTVRYAQRSCQLPGNIDVRKQKKGTQQYELKSTSGFSTKRMTAFRRSSSYSYSYIQAQPACEDFHD